MQYALRLPAANRIKPTARAHPGVEPVQVRKWLRKYAAAVCHQMAFLSQPPADDDVSDSESTSSQGGAMARVHKASACMDRTPCDGIDEDETTMTAEDEAGDEGEEDAEVVRTLRPVSRTAGSDATDSASPGNTPVAMTEPRRVAPVSMIHVLPSLPVPLPSAATAALGRSTKQHAAAHDAVPRHARTSGSSIQGYSSGSGGSGLDSGTRPGAAAAVAIDWDTCAAANELLFLSSARPAVLQHTA